MIHSSCQRQEKKINKEGFDLHPFLFFFHISLFSFFFSFFLWGWVGLGSWVGKGADLVATGCDAGGGIDLHGEPPWARDDVIFHRDRGRPSGDKHAARRKVEDLYIRKKKESEKIKS